LQRRYLPVPGATSATAEACPKCGVLSKQGANFCESCGHRL
jgi:uncharacterized Zn finger protein (UPF0148 family)